MTLILVLAANLRAVEKTSEFPRAQKLDSRSRGSEGSR
jgi:hypothetical protein